MRILLLVLFLICSVTPACTEESELYHKPHRPHVPGDYPAYSRKPFPNPDHRDNNWVCISIGYSLQGGRGYTRGYYEVSRVWAEESSIDACYANGWYGCYVSLCN